MTVLKIEARDRSVTDALNRLVEAGRNLTPAMRTIRMVLLSQAEKNFADQAGPAGRWDIPPLKPATRKDRAKRGKSQILQDSGRLAASVTAGGGSDATSAWIGSNAVYAAIHQLGGDIERAAYSSWVRLRTDRKGVLVRQDDHPNLAVFAKDKHKRAVKKRYTTGPYTIHIPARPYLPATQAGLQAGVSEAIVAELARYIEGAAKG